MEVLAAVYGLEDAGSEARRLEAAGVDGVFTFEGPHDVFIPLALAAAATDLSVMTNVAIAFPRNAVHMAHAAWDLHVLSGGRCTLGLGTQVRPHIEGRFGVDFDRPVERMRDAVEAVRSVFRTWQDGVPLEHRGPFRTHTRMSPMFSPPPHPAGPPRIAVGALGPRLTAMAENAGTLQRNTSAGEALVLLRGVDSAEDLARLARVAEAAGPETRKVMAVLGSDAFRLLSRVSRLSVAAIGLVALAFSQLGALVLSLLGGLLRRLILRPEKRGDRRPVA